jgi:hypothetical protein
MDLEMEKAVFGSDSATGRLKEFPSLRNPDG